MNARADLLSSGSPVRLERFCDSCEEPGLVGATGDLHALELAVKPDIYIQVASILVEVKECPAAPRKVAALGLSQLRERAQLRQQCLQLIEVFLRRMPHPSSMTLNVSTAQESRAERAGNEPFSSTQGCPPYPERESADEKVH